MLIKNGLIYDMVQNTPYLSDIRTEGAKILEIKEGLIPRENEEVIDAAGKNVYPGLIDAHCHIGLHEQGLRKEGTDINEKVSTISPQLRGIDGYNPMDSSIADARNAGITTICTGPGSANVLGGTFFAVKTYGVCVDDVTVAPAVAMKCALGENPKFAYEKGEVNTRLGIVSKLREALIGTSEYIKRKEDSESESKKPPFDMKYEALIPVIKKEMPLKIHAHRADDICTALRIAREFDLKITLEHCTEGYLVLDNIRKAGCPVAIGPVLTVGKKPEMGKKTYENAASLSKAGIPVSIVTDAPVIPPETLPLCAAMCVKYGMDKWEALKAITINAAKHIGLENRIGSIEPGKDADLVITDGDILSVFTAVNTVIIDGKIIS